LLFVGGYLSVFGVSMLLLNILSDKSQLRPILVDLCADNVGKVYATGFVFLAGRVWWMR